MNIIQIQNQQQLELKNEAVIEETKEAKQNSQVIGQLPNGEALMMPTKKMKNKVKQYSSQPGNPVGVKQQRLPSSDKEEEHVFTGSEIEEYEQQRAIVNAQERQKQNKKVFQTLEDQSAQKVSTISSLGAGTQSALDS